MNSECITSAGSGHPRAAAILRDLTAAFTQQMFFWGMDAAVPTGNLFVKTGFEKSPSRGLQGTSCYSLVWRGGSVFLHGSCVGWLPQDGGAGVLFIRKTGKCVRWLCPEPPVPGEWPEERISRLDLMEGFPILAPFLEWWIEHEAWISAEMGSVYRANCYRKYRTLSKSKPWLAPEQGVAWLGLLLEDPAIVPRAKGFARRLAA